LGFPLLRALYGEHAISIAILNDQPGSFLVLSTLGIYSAFYFSLKNRSLPDSSSTANKNSPRVAMLKRFLSFPPVWAMILALALRSLTFPEIVNSVLSLGMRAMIPLALISVGAQLRFNKKQFEGELAPLYFGLGYKLVLAPLLMTFFLVGILHQNGETIRITLLESAMGPMITGAILADEYELNPPLCSLLVSTGIPLCLITVPIWAKCLEWAGI
jgi:predicted permease